MIQWKRAWPTWDQVDQQVLAVAVTQAVGQAVLVVAVLVVAVLVVAVLVVAVLVVAVLVGRGAAEDITNE
jgi:hypothetical protein